MPKTKSVTLPNEAATQSLAERLAKKLTQPSVILLEGEIGAGKTFFARCLIRALFDDSIEVPSPTFTIVQTYGDEHTTVWHCDLYRLTSVEEAMELGIDEAMEDHICLIEWPDRLRGHVPSTAISMSFEALQNGEHRVEITAPDSSAICWTSP